MRDTAHQCCRRHPNYAPQNEHFHQVPSAKVKTYGQYNYVIAGAKQPSNAAVKNNFCSFPLSSQNATVLSKCNCPLNFRSLDQQRNQRKLGRFEHKRVIIGPTLWSFLRANPRRQLMRVLAATRPPRKCSNQEHLTKGNGKSDPELTQQRRNLVRL